MALFSRSDLRLTRLRFPFAVRVTALAGTARLRDANARRDVRPDDPFVVPAFAHFDCDLRGSPGQPCAVLMESVPDTESARMAALGPEKHWSRALAGEIFRHPALAWDAALVGERWQVSPRLVRARLFAEGEALQSLLREQRAAHAFYAVASRPMCDPAAPGLLARQAGMRSGEALARACLQLFGADLRVLGEPSATTSTAPATTPGWPGWLSPTPA